MSTTEIFAKPKTASQSTTKPRIQFIDLAKGICILLVLIDHCGIQTGVWINHLRMPLYFILSGLFYKDYGSFMELVRKKTNNLIIPFITFYGIGLLYAFSIDVICHNDLASYAISVPEFLHDGPINNYALWFLLVLFWSNLLFWGISSIIRQEWLRAVIILSLAYLSTFVNADTGRSYVYIGSVLMNLPFFYTGYILKRTNILYDKKSTPAPIWGGGHHADYQLVSHNMHTSWLYKVCKCGHAWQSNIALCYMHT